MSSLPGSSLAPPIVPEIIFDRITDMTSCTTGMISWSTNGDPTDLTLYVTNDLQGGFEVPSTILNIPLGTNINPSLDKFSWSPVNVPQGNYQVLGLYNDFTSTSPTFFVANGTDVSCLPSPPAASTSSDPNTASSTSSASPSPSGIPVPISGALSNGSSSHAGAIAGGVIGGVALILLILLGLLFFIRLRRKHRARTSGSVGAGPAGGTGKWNGLSSRDSNLHSVLPTFAAQDRKVPNGIRRQSAGASSTGHGNGMEPTSPVGSDEDISTLAEEEKIAHAGTLGGNAFFNTSAPLPYTGQYHHRQSSTGSNLHSPISQLSPAASTRSTNRAAALAKLDSTAGSSPKSPYNRRPSLDGRVLSNSAPASAVHTPTTPSMSPAEMIPMNVNRASSGPRRATRKPVPTYSASDLDGSVAMERERSTSSGGHAHAQGPAFESDSTLGSANLKASLEDAHSVNLSHKSSFGDNRPVHYLIPDMPPPPKE